jgi:nickel-dependent lactate racemase
MTKSVANLAASIAGRVLGQGSATTPLSDSDLRKIVEQALENVPSGARVLAIVPDKTRDDNTHLLFPMASQVLAARKVAKLDALVAQGTHAPMTDAQKRGKIGASATETPNLGQIFDHAWDDPKSLVTLGELSGERIAQLTGGLMHEAVPVKLNSLLAPGVYDLILVFGATMPHEVAGFAGGAKYFFPGVAGPELTHMTHWLGAMAEIENVIGRVDTPTRRVIEAAAEFVSTPIISFTSVSTRDETGFHTFALFAGDIRKAMRRGAEISRQIHIKYTGRKYRQIIALLDSHYDEMWVGGKASYKLGGIIEQGGELIIYAPHLNQISATHGKLIEKYGYAPLESVREMVEGSPELRANLAIAAHLAHVAYGGARNSEGQVIPRFRITLASAVPEEVCRRVNLGYMDPRTFDRANYENDPDTKIVEDAGRDLYLVKPYESES